MTKKRREFDLGVKLRETTDATTTQGELRVDSADDKLKAFLDSSERSMVSEDQTQTLTSKTIDADNNTISELEVDNFKTGVIDEDLSSVSASHDTLPSAKAVKDYVDSEIALKDQASEISYDNASSGLTATDVQAAIDEVEARVDTVESTAKVDSFEGRTGAVTAQSGDYTAGEVTYSNTTSGLTATDTQAAIDEVEGRVDTLEGDSTLSDHLNGGANKHDASEIDYERTDGSKKNIDAASDDIESATTDLDDAIGALAGSPTNYTPSDATIVADHLSGIDSALATAGADEKADDLFRVVGSADATKKLAFEVDGLTTATTRTVTVPDANTTMVGIDVTQTLTNKTIDADNNTVSNLEVDNLKSGVLDTDLSAVSASHDTLPSAKAVKDYVDSEIALKDQAAEISYDNASSGLVATDVQAAIDEVEGRVDTLEGAGGSSLTVKEQDGAPTVSSVSEMRFPNASVTDETGGAVSIAFGASLTVEEEDASPSVSSVSKIKFPNGTVTDETGGVVSVDPAAKVLADITNVKPVRYQNTTSQSFTNNTNVIIDFGNLIYDDDSLVTNPSTDWKFVAPEDGYYYVNCGIKLAGSGSWNAGERFQLKVLKNGSVYSEHFNEYVSTTSSGMGFNTQATVELSAGDDIQIQGFQTSGGTINLNTTGERNFVEVVKTSGSAHVITNSDNVAPIRYSSNNGQTIAASTTTIVNFEDIEFDDDNLVTTGASWKWVAPRAGVIHVGSWVHTLNVNSTSFSCRYHVLNNSTVVATLDSKEADTTEQKHFGGATLIKVEKDDEIQLEFNNFFTSSFALTSNSDRNFVDIYYIDKSPLIALGNETTILKDEKSGSSGGSSVASGVQTRTLNTQYGSTTFCTLASSQFTLTGPGKYSIEFSAPAFKVDGHQAYLYDIDAAGIVAGGEGNVGYTQSGNDIIVCSEGYVIIDITATTTYELRHFTETATASIGLGVQSSGRTGNPTTTDVYSTVKIVKLK